MDNIIYWLFEIVSENPGVLNWAAGFIASELLAIIPSVKYNGFLHAIFLALSERTKKAQ